MCDFNRHFWIHKLQMRCLTAPYCLLSEGTAANLPRRSSPKIQSTSTWRYIHSFSWAWPSQKCTKMGWCFLFLTSLCFQFHSHQMQPRVDDAEALYANVEMLNWREADVIPKQVLRGRWTLSQLSLGERQEYQLDWAAHQSITGNMCDLFKCSWSLQPAWCSLSCNFIGARNICKIKSSCWTQLMC